MNRHHALEDTITRARHYGAIASDALALFPASAMKSALEEAVEFCIARTH
jgi:octaprenyl-diphosphate synthase